MLFEMGSIDDTHAGNVILGRTVLMVLTKEMF